MSVKLADTLAPMSDFPVAEAKDVSIEIGGTDKSLQDAYEDGDLGGGGSNIQVDTMPLASDEYADKIVEFVGATGTYTNGYFYKCVEDAGVYSWVQHNVQPSNATASEVSYNNTTSELTATNVQDAIDEVVDGLGTASGKGFTDEVRPGSRDLVESNAVYSAINHALSTIYVPRGDLSCAELTSALLVAGNVGNVYQMSDAGYTSALFINGAGILINTGDNVGIIKAGADEILFNYMGNAFDLTDYQKKDLSSAVEGATTVEGALGALSTAKVDKSDTYNLYYPSFELYNSWADFLELLHQQGNGRYCGKAYLDSKWWSYIATITVQANLWNGTAVFLQEQDGTIKEAHKKSDNLDTWTITKMIDETDLTSSVTSGSNAPVTSGGVANYIRTYHVEANNTNTLTITLPTFSEGDAYEIIVTTQWWAGAGGFSANLICSMSGGVYVLRELSSTGEYTKSVSNNVVTISTTDTNAYMRARYTKI